MGTNFLGIIADGLFLLFVRARNYYLFEHRGTILALKTHHDFEGIS
jgi:hypothetical protein